MHFLHTQKCEYAVFTYFYFKRVKHVAKLYADLSDKFNDSFQAQENELIESTNCFIQTWFWNENNISLEALTVPVNVWCYSINLYFWKAAILLIYK